MTSMLHLDSQFVQLLAPRLERFKTKSSSLFNCRCPFCEAGTPGRKARGYFYERGGHLFFYCHHCGESMGMPRFLRRIDSHLYLEYVRERAVLNPHINDDITPLRVPPSRVLSRDGLVPLSTLPETHTAMRYARNRELSDKWIRSLLYAQDFFAWARKIEPSKYTNARVEPRLVIPFIGRDGMPTGFQGRALDDMSSIKYITVIVRPAEPFLFGLDKISEESAIIALEGPIDAMFIDNAIASGGGVISRELDRARLDPTRVVIAYDNERRSLSTIRKMQAAVHAGWRVCIWPTSMTDKDINDMISSGLETNVIRQVIEQCAKSGASALGAISEWKKC